MSLILFTNGHQTLEVDRFVNNIKPGEAYKKFQAEVNKAPKQIKEQLIPNQNEKKDELDLNKHSNALKEIDEKVKNYQSNQGSLIIQPLVSKQLLPNDQQIVQDNLKVINSLKHPIIPFHHPIPFKHIKPTNWFKPIKPTNRFKSIKPANRFKPIKPTNRVKPIKPTNRFKLSKQTIDFGTANRSNI